MRVTTAHPFCADHDGMSTSKVPSPGISDTGNEPPAALVDEMLAFYIDWRHDAAEVAVAYEGWRTAPSGDEQARFAAYMSALDQEESAAASYALVVQQVQRATDPDRGPSMAATSEP